MAWGMETLSNAWDSFTGLFGFNNSGSAFSDGWESSDGIDYDFKGDQAGYDAFQADYADGTLDGDYSRYQGNDPVIRYWRKDPVKDKNDDKPWYSSLLTSDVLGAAITSGAGLLQGMSKMEMEKQQLKAAEEQRKMNQMLELAKLKYQLMGKGAGGGGRRSGGSGAANRAQAIDLQASNNLAAGYQNMGNSLASIYRP
jgi:hypothetical protein